MKRGERQDLRAISKFMSYLSSDEVQAKWHITTGYIPLTHSSIHYCQTHNLYSKNPAAKIAATQVWVEKKAAIPMAYI